MQKREIFKPIIFGVIAYLATYALGLLGMALAGDGSGSATLGFLFMSPFFKHSDGAYTAFGPYLWAIAFALLPMAARKSIGGIIITIVTIACWGSAKDIFQDIRESGTWSYTIDLFHKVPLLAGIVIGGYIAMQIIIFKKLFKVFFHEEDGAY